MKALKIIAIIFAALGGFIFISGYLNSRPISKEAAVAHLASYFKKAGKPGKNYSGVQVLVKSGSTGIETSFAYGDSARSEGKKLQVSQPFHIASIGKLFTAVIIMKLCEENRLKLSDPVSLYLDKKTLEGLFQYNGVDYTKQVTIRQLLSHESGAADYFEDPVIKGEMSIPWQIVTIPDTMWTPEMLLDFTRENVAYAGKPGKLFHYSDTNYILLGLVAEKIEKKPFHEILRGRILLPLKMNETWMPLRSKPANKAEKPLADIWFMGKEVGTFTSLSADWAGGGIASTPGDLLLFQEALWSGKIISQKSLDTLFDIKNKFRDGIYYGLGTMEIRFEEFFFLLKGMPRVRGHIGILSTQLFYEPISKTHIIINFGSDAKMQDSFMALIEIMNTLRRIKMQ